jgi:7-cyano-7-deazaguanine reductase
MSIEQSPLGHAVRQPTRYDPSVLFPIARAENRSSLFQGKSLPESLPFAGADIWNAYELSWLDARGKPEVAMATFTVPAESPNIIESKSFKLYLNSFNQTRLDDSGVVLARLQTDVSAATGSAVDVQLILPSAFGDSRITELEGCDIDAQNVDISCYEPAPHLLRVADRADVVDEVLTSRLLRSNCPVTGQPDWGSVQIHYRGPRIDRAGLLAYIVSFREHAEFHEHCVERMFTDLMTMCHCEALTVYARYTRRGGLDINPWRSNTGLIPPPNVRTARQ